MPPRLGEDVTSIARGRAVQGKAALPGSVGVAWPYDPRSPHMPSMWASVCQGDEMQWCGQSPGSAISAGGVSLVLGLVGVAVCPALTHHLEFAIVYKTNHTLLTSTLTTCRPNLHLESRASRRTRTRAACIYDAGEEPLSARSASLTKAARLIT